MDKKRFCANRYCNNYVPKYYVDDNGKKHNCQRRKYCFGCSPFGQHNTRQLENSFGRKIKTCPICKKEHNQKCNICMACYFVKRQKEKIKQTIDIVGNSCWICNYNKTWKNLCFHHVCPEHKLFCITSRELVGTKWNKVLDEMKKCILVCTNCHGEIHDSLIEQNIVEQTWKQRWGL